MQGTENIPEVIAFKNEHRGTLRTHLLKYIYFCYAKDERNPYRYLLPSERKQFVIDVNELFEKKDRTNPKYWQQIENIPAVKPLIDCLLSLTYSNSERQRLVYLEKIEKYMDILSSPDAAPSAEKEADEMISIFSKRLEEIEVQIARESETEDPSTGSIHLFELPAKVNAFYKKIGYN